MDDSTETEYPSMDIVRDEIDTTIAEQKRRGTAFDSRAGFLLGLSGVLIGLAARHVGVFRLAGQIVAALGAAAAFIALLPRASAGLSLRAMRDRYLPMDAATTKRRMLGTRIVIYEREETRLMPKIHWIKYSAALVSVAVVLLVTGTIVDFWIGEAS